MARPFGVHLWFDPSVESVVLLDEPVDFLCVSETPAKKRVDKPVQQCILGESSSVSGQAGSVECENHKKDIDQPEGSELVVPF